MSSVSFLRHNSFFGPEDVTGKCLNIIGVGATGSWVGLLAAKMGWHKFRVWDLDVVESHNCPNQIYDLDQVGMKKVDAFEAVLKRFNPQVIVEKYDCFFESSLHADLLEDYVFIAVDSNSARKDIFECLEENLSVDLAIETKMGFTHAELNVMRPFTGEFKAATDMLVSDEKLTESACNARIITTLTNIIASNVVHIFSAYAAKYRKEKTLLIQRKTIFQLDPYLKIYSI